MRREMARFGTAMATVVLALAPVAMAGEIPVDKVPEPIAATVKTRFPDAKLMGAAKEKTPEGNEIYEITLEDKAQMNIDATFTPDGAVTLIEQEIARKDLPKPVLATLDEKYPKAKFRLVESIFTVVDKVETLKGYEVLLLTPKKVFWSVEMAPDGKIVLEEKKASETED